MANPPDDRKADRTCGPQETASRATGGSRPVDKSSNPRTQNTATNASAKAPTHPQSLVNVPLPFTTLGRYTVLRELGRGGMGTVYLAEDTMLKRQVALKIPQFEPGKAEQTQARFVREAQMAASLSHPNICQVFDVAVIDGWHVMAMEYIDGRTLSAYTKPEKLLPERQAVLLVKKVALAVEAAHQKKMIHRDLKPGNIMLAKTDASRKSVEPKVMDFGLAKRLGGGGAELTKSGMIIGTPCYMSKEQWSAKDGQVGPASDVYSMGMILYELLTGKLPYDVGDDEPATAWFVRLVTRDQVPLRARRPNIDAGLESIVMRSIDIEQNDRYATMSEFAKALDEWLKGKFVGTSGSELNWVDEQFEWQEEVVRSTPQPGGRRASSTQGNVQQKTQLVVTEQKNQETGASLVPRLAIACGVIGLVLVGTLFLRKFMLSEPPVANTANEVAIADVAISSNPEATESSISGAVPSTSGDVASAVSGTDTSTSSPVAGEPVVTNSIEMELIPATANNAMSTNPEKAESLASAAIPSTSGDFASAVSGTDGATSSLVPREPDITNSIGIKLKLIPAGEFMMGSPLYEPSRKENEGPQQKVRITRPFYIGVTEVTQGQWYAVMKTQPWGGKHDVPRGINYPATLGNNYPATYVTWDDAVEYCEKLSAQEGKYYRLPTEAEWEYACRGGTSTAYSFGDDAVQLSDYACWGEIEGDGNARPKKYANEVSSKKANPYGLYDMHGNVYEWCSDWFGTYNVRAAVDPQGPSTGSYRVYRGGCWEFSSRYCRSAGRDSFSPSFCNGVLGFRVVLSPLGVSNSVDLENISTATPDPGKLSVNPPAPNQNQVGISSAVGNSESAIDSTEPDQNRSSSLLSTEPSITNSIGMKLKLIPAGEFMMGSNATRGELEADGFVLPDGFNTSDEQPTHRVRITKPFYMGIHEVTRGQFAAFVTDGGYRTDAERDGKGGSGFDAAGNGSQKPEYTWKNNGMSQTDSHPVVNVSWNDAVEFIKWLSKKEGKQYRLPTEAEWEYCCRAGKTTHFSSGNSAASLMGFGNVKDASNKRKYTNIDEMIPPFPFDDGVVYTSPVGRFKPNEFGLHDMQGNVSEHCSDWYGKDYYATSPLTDPGGPTAGSSRAYRGGCWDHSALYCRSADRGRFDPGDQFSGLGFRLALSAAEANSAVVNDYQSTTTPVPSGVAPNAPQITTSVSTPPIGSADSNQMRRPSLPSTEPSITNSIGMKLKLIPAGEFMMGAPLDEAGRNVNEGPQHKVRITKPFYIGVTEVTQGHWFAVMKTMPWERKEFVTEGDNYPACYVSWDEAVEYCRKLSDIEGKTYRLPTEAEWEYACRGGTSTAYNFGSDASQLSDHACWGGSAGNARPFSHAVGMKPSNQYGLFDMHGNMWELCSDRYGDYSSIGPLSGSGRVMRGGSWIDVAERCRSASRSQYVPSMANSSMGSVNGFRLALSPISK